MRVTVKDWLGGEYEVMDAQIKADSVLGPCLIGHYRPLGEFIGYGLGSFRIETLKSWCVEPDKDAYSPPKLRSVEANEGSGNGAKIPAFKRTESTQKMPRQRVSAPGPVTGRKVR